MAFIILSVSLLLSLVAFVYSLLAYTRRRREESKLKCKLDRERERELKCELERKLNREWLWGAWAVLWRVACGNIKPEHARVACGGGKPEHEAIMSALFDPFIIVREEIGRCSTCAFERMDCEKVTCGDKAYCLFKKC